MICIWTLKDAKIEIKIREKYLWCGNDLYRQKYRYQYRSKKEPNEVYVYYKFYFKFLNESKAFTLFLYF